MHNSANSVTEHPETSNSVVVLVSHGTSSPVGQSAVSDAALTAGLPLCHVDVQQPDVPTTLALIPAHTPTVLVPFLLSAGYHVHNDLAEARDASGNPNVFVADALGPDPRLITLLQRRLSEAGVTADDLVVFAAAGSSDRRAVDDCHAMARLLSAARGQHVPIGFLSAAEPRLGDLVAQSRESLRSTQSRRDRAPRRVVVATYLLAPGYFYDLVTTVGADIVAQPLLDPSQQTPREIVDIIGDRARAATRAMASLDAEQFLYPIQ